MTFPLRPLTATPCPDCGLTSADAGELRDEQGDPFAHELERHGIHARPFDNANRDAVRKLADPAVRPAPCSDCKALIDGFDAAFAAHLFG